MNPHRSPRTSKHCIAGFTIVETAVALGILGIGVACVIGTLTKMNAIATTSRNISGAYAAVMSQIDLFESLGPFNPQSNPQQIPRDATHNPPLYDMTVGTHTIGYLDPTTNTVSNQWPIYQYSDPNGNTILVKGTLTIQVTDISNADAPKTYRAIVTIRYDYGNHTLANGNPYTFSMSALRTSDS